MAAAKGDMRRKLRQLGQLITEGKSEDDICSSLALDSPDELDPLLERYYAELIDKIRHKSPERQFTDYLTQQSRGIWALDQLVRDLRTKDGKFTASVAGSIVSAVRARADIIDRIQERGQKLGMLKKELKQRMVKGIPAAQLSPDQLRGAIYAQVKQLAELQELDVLPLEDLDPGDIYREDLPVPTGGVRAKRRTKRAAGRRVVKQTTAVLVTS